MKIAVITALGLAGLLCGCASTPYWQNPQWINKLAATISNGLVYPSDALQAGPASAQAVVLFTYDNGRLRDVSIVKSTGNQILDAAITTEIARIKPPPAWGSDTKLPRQFQLPVNLSTGQSEFTVAIRDAIVRELIGYYPRTAALSGQQARVDVQFEYRNGHVVKQTVVKIIGSKAFEKAFEAAALEAVASAKMPLPPPWAHDRTFSFTIPICFTIKAQLCPGPNTLTQYISSHAQEQTKTAGCAEVAFSYKDGAIVNAHILSSSGSAALDQTALHTISEGDFSQPTRAQQENKKNFQIPVCFRDRATNQSPAKAPS